MEFEEKIEGVIKKVLEKRMISPNPDLIKYTFYPSDYYATGLAVGEEERDILVKLQNEGAFEIQIPEGIYRYSDFEDSLKHVGYVLLKINEKFNKVSNSYIRKKSNYWLLTSPVWLIWIFFRWLWAKKKKLSLWQIIVRVGGIVALLVGLIQLFEWVGKKYQ